MNRKETHITALINGEPVKVPRGKTILDAAIQNSIFIPTLCHLENLKSYGGCRLCVVDIKGRKGYPTACTTPIEAGMEIKTKTPGIQKLRREILELTLSEHPYTCLVCKDKKECGEFMHSTRKAGTITGCNFCTSNGDCELQDLIDYLDLKDVRYPIAYRGIPPVKDNPFYDLDYNLCIHCGRCVRICNEERNSRVLAFIERGNSTIVGTAFAESQADAGCEFCGACVDVCPTGSISEKMGKWAGLPDKSTETTCTLCSLGCTMNVNTRQGRVINIGPKPGERMNPHQLCIRGKFLLGDITHHPSRITTPLIRRKDKWVEVSWDEAINYTASKLEKYRGNGFGMLGSNQDTIEENYSLQKFSYDIMKTENIDLLSGSLDVEQRKSLSSLLSGSGGISELKKADTILLLGTDASLTHPLLENRIRKAYNNGVRILYVNQISTRTSQFSRSEIYIKKGNENIFLYMLIALLAKEVVPELPAGLAKYASKTIMSKALKSCSVKMENLQALVGSLAKTRNLCIIAGGTFMEGPTVKETIKALGNILYLKNGTSRCNIIIPEFTDYNNGSVLAGVHSNRITTRNEMLANIGREGISALMVAGDLPPDRKFKKLKFLVQLNMFATGLSEFADVFLPVTGLLENEGHFPALDGKIKKVRRTIPIQGTSRTIPAIITALAKEMGGIGFTDKPGRIWKEIQEQIRKPEGKPKKLLLTFQPLNPSDRREASGKRMYTENGYGNSMYRGNKMANLVHDLQSLAETLMDKKV